jgi:hypothetical protein
LFASKIPFAVYFAEDFSGNTLPNYIANGRDATTTGIITKTTAAGNGATSALTYITGTTASTVSFATGSIPATFTILSFTRYNGGTRQRILTSKQPEIGFTDIGMGVKEQYNMTSIEVYMLLQII